MINGPGKNTADKDEHHGNWLNGKLDGFGLYKSADGQYYKGMWKHGKPHGHGVFTSPDGEKYDGTSLFI
jgi:hypothetical protein